MSFAVSGSADAGEPGGRVLLMALGDSITAGTPAFRSPAEFPPSGRGNPQSQYGYWIEKKHPEWKLINRGIAGQTTLQILARVDDELDTFKPQAVLLMAGVNDIYRGVPAPEITGNLLNLYNHIHRRKIPVMLLTILPYRGLTDEKFERLQKINQWIKDFTGHSGAGFCDTYAVMRAAQDPRRLISSSSDGLHPDLAGYRRMGEAVGRALEAWMPSLPKG